jgi:hypothetical protein
VQTNGIDFPPVQGPKDQASPTGTLFIINEINGLTDSISSFGNNWAGLTA